MWTIRYAWNINEIKIHLEINVQWLNAFDEYTFAKPVFYEWISITALHMTIVILQTWINDVLISSDGTVSHSFLSWFIHRRCRSDVQRRCILNSFTYFRLWRGNLKHFFLYDIYDSVNSLKYLWNIGYLIISEYKKFIYFED